MDDSTSQRDADADAETLLLMAKLSPWDRQFDDILDADCTVWARYQSDTFRFVDAARAAFRAVPGLRGGDNS